MHYSLGIGFGEDPLDLNQLEFVYEKNLQVFPAMAITLCYPKSLAARPDRPQIDVRKTLRVFQGFELLNPIPLDRMLTHRTTITNVYDKGAGRGILWTYENRIHDDEGTPFAHCTEHPCA